MGPKILTVVREQRCQPYSDGILLNIAGRLREIEAYTQTHVHK